MDTLDPDKRRLVMQVLAAQEARLRVARSGWRWWEITLFLAGWAGFAWFQHQGLLADARSPERMAAATVPFHVVVALIVVPVAFLLVYLHALHRRIDALIGLLGDQLLTTRAVGEIRALNQGEGGASSVATGSGDTP